MATNYNINILKLKGCTVDGQDNVVTSINYELIGEDDGTQYTVTASIKCDYDADNFTPINDLTENQVKGWITSDTDNHPGYIALVDEKIAKLKLNEVEITKPW